MIKRLAIILLVLCIVTPISYAYLDKYPPYKFKDGPPRHLEAKPIVDYDKPEYKSPDGKIYVQLSEENDKFSFIIKDGKTTVTSMKERSTPVPQVVWWADLDGNGFKDFIVFGWYEANGLAFYHYQVDLFMKEREGVYNKISYDSQGPGMEDFVDLNNDGKHEIIITDIRSIEGHTYFTYNVYELKDYQLVNVDAKYRGFPKFIWYTFKPNDKDTTRLTKEERALHTKQKNDSIKYSEIR